MFSCVVPSAARATSAATSELGCFLAASLRPRSGAFLLASWLFAFSENARENGLGRHQSASEVDAKKRPVHSLNWLLSPPRCEPPSDEGHGRAQHAEQNSDDGGVHQERDAFRKDAGLVLRFEGGSFQLCSSELIGRGAKQKDVCREEAQAKQRRYAAAPPLADDDAHALRNEEERGREKDSKGDGCDEVQSWTTVSEQAAPSDSDQAFVELTS